MRIGELAKAANVGVETIRFYERRGIIRQPPRPSNGSFRQYPQDVVRRIKFIRQAQELGFSLSEIEDLLSLKSDPSNDCSEVRRRALAKREDVNDKIGQLTRIHATLTTLIDACPGKGALEFCAILDAMEEGEYSKSGRDRTKWNGKS